MVKINKLIIEFLLFYAASIFGEAVFTKLVLALYPGLKEEVMMDLSDFSLINLASSLVISPFVETVILVYSIYIGSQVIKDSRYCLAFSVIPICLIHIVVFWQLAFVVFPLFYIQGMAYGVFRKKVNRNAAIILVTALHFVFNLSGILLALW